MKCIRGKIKVRITFISVFFKAYQREILVSILSFPNKKGLILIALTIPK